MTMSAMAMPATTATLRLIDWGDRDRRRSVMRLLVGGLSGSLVEAEG